MWNKAVIKIGFAIAGASLFCFCKQPKNFVIGICKSLLDIAMTDEPETRAQTAIIDTLERHLRETLRNLEQAKKERVSRLDIASGFFHGMGVMSTGSLEMVNKTADMQENLNVIHGG